MSITITNYTFDASERTITFTDAEYTNIFADLILEITNTTRSINIYTFNTSTQIGTTLGNVLTLIFDTTQMQDSDDLLILYAGASGGATSAEQIVQTALLTSIDTELNTQTTALGLVNAELDAQTALLTTVDSELGVQTTALGLINTELDTQTALLTTANAESIDQGDLLSAINELAQRLGRIATACGIAADLRVTVLGGTTAVTGTLTGVTTVTTVTGVTTVSTVTNLAQIGAQPATQMIPAIQNQTAIIGNINNLVVT